MKRLAIYFLLLGTCLYGCGDSKEQTDQDDLEKKLEEDAMTSELKVSDESINDIFQNIPSPLEISVLLKESGINYDHGFLNDVENAKNYETDFQKAINLGVFGTDLGYINIYEQNQDAIAYVQVIRDQADALNIGQYFDFQTIRSLVSERNNLDSLLQITTQNFNLINAHLQEQKRADVSILLLSGGWLEALYLTNSVFNQNKNNMMLREKIGEQKIVLSQLILLIEQFKSNPKIAKLAEKMAPLKAEYDKVTIKRIVKEPIVKEVDGILFIEDQSETIVEMSDEVLAAIQMNVEKIRTDLVK